MSFSLRDSFPVGHPALTSFSWCSLISSLNPNILHGKPFCAGCSMTDVLEFAKSLSEDVLWRKSKSQHYKEFGFYSRVMRRHRMRLRREVIWYGLYFQYHIGWYLEIRLQGARMYTGISTGTDAAVSAGCNVVCLKGHKEYEAI